MRERAPPYFGEGPHALWHMSEDASIERFEPHRAFEAIPDEPLVWAIDTRHQPLFWFPRECPRGTFWAGPRTTADDVERFLDGQPVLRVHAMEAGWLGAMRSARVYAYRMPGESFSEHPEVLGYWISRETVEPLERVEVGDLLERHVTARIELRLVSNLWPLWDRVAASSLEFSGIRLRNAEARVRTDDADG